jgi:hypothetical protein
MVVGPSGSSGVRLARGVQRASRGRCRVSSIVRCALLVLSSGAGSATGLAQATTQDTLPTGVPASLSSVSCPSRGFCMAVGQVGGKPLALRFAHRSWSTVSVPASSIGGFPAGSLNSVSCTSSRACTAVGATSQQSFAEHWNGSLWSLQKTWNQPPVPFADPNSTTTALNGVTCTAAKACIAVGSSGWSAAGCCGGSSRLAERWNGRSWTVVEAPRLTTNNGGSGGNGLDSVSCSSARTCTAVGEAVDSGGRGSSFVQRFDGRRWTTQRELGSAGVRSVSCPSTESCTAVGLRDDNVSPLSRARGLAARWDGRHWTIDPIHRLKHGTELDGVSCPIVTRCVAVGASPPPVVAPGAPEAPASASFNGIRWVAHRMPFRAGWQASPNGLSCASPADCMAVGETFTLAPPNASAQETILVEHWSGRKWTIQQTP